MTTWTGGATITEPDTIYLDPDHYDVLAQMTAPPDYDFYQALADRHGGPVLDLGCGTGRVSIPLARAGLAVAGIDHHERMLTRALEKAATAGVEMECFKGDLRAFDLERTFRLMLLTYNTINHLVDLESVAACFNTVAAHMDHDSRFIIDTFNPSLEFLGSDRSEPLKVVEYVDPITNAKVILTETSVYDAATQVNKVVWSYEVDGRADAIVHRMDMRIFFPQELDALARVYGFTIENKFGDYDQRPFASESAKQILVCRLSE